MCSEMETPFSFLTDRQRKEKKIHLPFKVGKILSVCFSIVIGFKTNVVPVIPAVSVLILQSIR